MNPSEGESYGPALGVWCSRPRDRARKCHAGWPRSRRWAVVGGRLMICFRPRATLWCPRRGGDLRVPRGEGGWRGAPRPPGCHAPPPGGPSCRVAGWRWPLVHGRRVLTDGAAAAGR